MSEVITNDMIDKMTVKEFMEWFVSEYDGYFFPSEITACINRLEGYSVAKRDSEEGYILSAALQNLRNFQTLLSQLKRSDWKYRGQS